MLKYFEHFYYSPDPHSQVDLCVEPQSPTVSPSIPFYHMERSHVEMLVGVGL